MTDLLNNDYDIADLIEEVSRNEIKRGRGRPAGTPQGYKVPGSGRPKQIFNHANWNRMDSASYVVSRLREVLNNRDFNELTNDEILKHLKAFNEFIQPKLSAIKQQTITLHQYDPTVLTEEQLQVLMTIPITHSIGQDIETNIPELDAPECIENEGTEGQPS